MTIKVTGIICFQKTKVDRTIIQHLLLYWSASESVIWFLGPKTTEKESTNVRLGADSQDSLSCERK